MNRNKNYDKRPRQRLFQTVGISGMYPPGGLVTWPDGSTSRTGERRMRNLNIPDNRIKLQPIAAIPEKAEQMLSA